MHNRRVGGWEAVAHSKTNEQNQRVKPVGENNERNL
jgi:hypothetical protein